MNPWTWTTDVPERFLTTSADYYVALLAMFAAFWGGVVSYFRRLEQGDKHSALAAVAHIATSGFAGLLAWLACVGTDVPAPITGVICGLAGHMGAELIRIAEVRLMRQLAAK